MLSWANLDSTLYAIRTNHTEWRIKNGNISQKNAWSTAHAQKNKRLLLLNCIIFQFGDLSFLFVLSLVFGRFLNCLFEAYDYVFCSKLIHFSIKQWYQVTGYGLKAKNPLNYHTNTNSSTKRFIHGNCTFNRALYSALKSRIAGQRYLCKYVLEHVGFSASERDENMWMLNKNLSQQAKNDTLVRVSYVWLCV